MIGHSTAPDTSDGSRSLASPAHTALDEATGRLALLIDADNAQPLVIEALLAEVARFGEATVRRIYGDFTSPASAGWKKFLNKHSIKPVQQFAYTKGKNATDSAMIIDAMDLLYTRRFDGFCLVTSDSDFTGLAIRLREGGLKVFGFGEQKTPEPFRIACHKFFLHGDSSFAASCAGDSDAAAQCRRVTAAARGFRRQRAVRDAISTRVPDRGAREVRRRSRLVASRHLWQLFAEDSARFRFAAVRIQEAVRLGACAFGAVSHRGPRGPWRGLQGLVCEGACERLNNEPHSTDTDISLVGHLQGPSPMRSPSV